MLVDGAIIDGGAVAEAIRLVESASRTAAGIYAASQAAEERQVLKDVRRDLKMQIRKEKLAGEHPRVRIAQGGGELRGIAGEEPLEVLRGRRQAELAEHGPHDPAVRAPGEVDVVEPNISCPTRNSSGGNFAMHEGYTRDVIKAIRAKTEPLPKLSPAALATLEKGKAA